MSVLRIVSAVSGPGVTITIADTPRNAASCAATRRSVSDNQVGKTSGMRSRLSRALAATALAALIAVALAAAAPGDLDPTFSGNGWVRTYDVLGYSRQYFPKGAEHIAIQPDGKIIGVSEIQSGGSDYYFGVFRWTPNGDLDRSFGAGGWVTTELGPFAIAHAVALQRDGKIVVAGEAVCDLAGCFGLVRYNRDGSLDRTFSGAGRATVGFGPHRFDYGQSLDIQRDGRIVAAGSSSPTLIGAPRVAIVRLRRNGTVDRRFGSGGKQITNPVPSGGYA